MTKKETIVMAIILAIAFLLLYLGSYEKCLEMRGYTEENAPESVKYNCAL